MAHEFCLKMPDFHVTFRDLLHAVNLRHGTDGFTSLQKEGVMRILSPWKSDGFGRVLNRELGYQNRFSFYYNTLLCRSQNFSVVKNLFVLFISKKIKTELRTCSQFLKPLMKSVDMECGPAVPIFWKLSFRMQCVCRLMFTGNRVRFVTEEKTTVL